MTKVPPIYSKEEFRIHACEECGEDLVRFQGKLLCKVCITISKQALPGWEPEDVPFEVVFPNRASRRAAEKELRKGNI